MNESTEKLQFMVLKALSLEGELMGAGAITDMLHDAGFSISEATVGRLLKSMRIEGLLSRVGYQGHQITIEGRERLRELDAQLRVSEALRSCVNEGMERGSAYLCDVMKTLRSLGREALIEVTNSADDAKLSGVEETIKKHSSPDGPQEGLFAAFYRSIFGISGIPMFEHFFNLMGASVAGDPEMTRAFRGAENEIGSYEKILEAVKAREPQAAIEMMNEQIDKVIDFITGSED